MIIKYKCIKSENKSSYSHTWHELKVNQEGGHENHLDGEDADGEDDDDPEEVVDGEHDGDGEGSEEKPGNHRDEGESVSRSGRMKDRHIHFCWIREGIKNFCWIREGIKKNIARIANAVQCPVSLLIVWMLALLRLNCQKYHEFSQVKIGE